MMSGQSGKRRDSLSMRIIFMRAAGRDFHNVNTVLRDDPVSEVVALAAGPVPNIEKTALPPGEGGPRYPESIPIHAEVDRPRLIRETRVAEVVFATTTSPTVLPKAPRVLAGSKPDLEDALRNV
jgi:predicted GTPase